MNIFLSDTLWPPVIHVHLILGGGGELPYLGFQGTCES